MRSMPPEAWMYLAFILSTDCVGAWLAWARASVVTNASSIRPSWERGEDENSRRSRGRNGQPACPGRPLCQDERALCQNDKEPGSNDGTAVASPWARPFGTVSTH